MKRVLLFTLFFCTALFYTNAYSASPEKSAKKILVVYYSRTNNTKGVAEDIAKKLNADIERIVDKKDRSGVFGYAGAAKDSQMKNATEIGEITKNPADYDLVIVGTPIWVGHVPPPTHTYLVKYKSSFKQVAFFCTAGGNPITKISGELEEYSGKKAAALIGFTSQDLKPENRNDYDKKMNGFITTLSAVMAK
jgi:flavodoxin